MRLIDDVTGEVLLLKNPKPENVSEICEKPVATAVSSGFHPLGVIREMAAALVSNDAERRELYTACHKRLHEIRQELPFTIPKPVS